MGPIRITLHGMKIIGFGLDNDDGHTRITRGDAFELFDGSEKSHEEMAALCQILDEAFRDRGGSLATASKEEIKALVEELGLS